MLFLFLAALPEYPAGGSELSDKSVNFRSCLHKQSEVDDTGSVGGAEE